MKTKAWLIAVIVMGVAAAMVVLRPTDDSASSDGAFAVRLELAAAKEEAICATLGHHAPAMFGETTEDLGPREGQVLAALARDHLEVRNELDRIKIDLRDHAARGGRQERVLLEIDSPEVATTLDRIYDDIAKNRSFDAGTSARGMAKQLRGWAAILRGDP